MTQAEWEALADVYVNHGDPRAPENARLIHVAQCETELDLLERQGRL